MEDLLQKLSDYAVDIGIRLLISIIVLIICSKLIKVAIKKISKSKFLNKLDAGVHSFILSTLKIVLYILLIITIALILGIPMTSFIAILTSASLTIGLALQGSLSNFAGGIMILIFKPFKVGDYVTSKDGEGTVKSINIFYTVLETPDNKQITVPNAIVSNEAITNASANDLRRVDLTITTSYDNDIELTKNILMNMAQNHPLALSDPAPIARLQNHGDSSLVFAFRIWCKKDNYWDLYFDLCEQVKREFDQNNIQIPYPQLDVHVRSDK